MNASIGVTLLALGLAGAPLKAVAQDDAVSSAASQEAKAKAANAEAVKSKAATSAQEKKNSASSQAAPAQNSAKPDQKPLKKQPKSEPGKAAPVQTPPKGGTAPVPPKNGGTKQPPILNLPPGGIVITPGPPGGRSIPGFPAPPGGAEGSGVIAKGTKFTFDFKGSEIINVLKLFSMMSGKTIVTDPGLSGNVTIINPKQVTLDDAFKILQSVLIVRGYTALENGDVLQILPFDKAKSAATIVSPDPDPAMLDPKNQVMTQVIPLDNGDAEAMAKDLLPLISPSASLIGSSGTNSLILTDTASNVRRIIELVSALDKASNRTPLKIYPLRHAVATSVATTINDLYKQITSRGKGGAPPQPGQPNFGQPGQPAPAGGARPAVVAVADVNTNSVIVVASEENQDQIASKIIKRLDDDEAAILTTEVIKLKFANCVDVANLVNNVLSNMYGTPAASSGGGGGRSFGGFNPFGFGGGGGGGDASATTTSTDPFGKVIADQHTNNLFVTANPERMIKIKDLIAKIDVDVPVETTTFVVPLKNAQASDVAYALSQAFSTNNNNNGGYTNYNIFGGGGNSGSNGRQRQPIQRRQGASTPFGTGRSIRRSTPPPPNSPDPNAQGDDPNSASGGSAIPQGIAGVMTNQGFVPLDTQDSGISAQQAEGANGDRTRQYYFGGYGGGGRGSVGQSNGPQYGRGSTGTYSNLLRLQNNVFVNASPDGESLIITTTPDNFPVLKALIQQLDIVPRQVMVEVIIAEVSLDTDQKFGFNISGMLNRIFSSATNVQGQISNPAAGFTSNTLIDQTASGAQAVISGANYTSILQALSTDNKVKVLSTPRVFASNNQQAVFESVVNIPFINGQTSNGFISTSVSNQVDYIKIGLTMNVTPRITREGKVTMDIEQEASDLIGFDNLGTGQSAIRAPRYNDRYANTSVTIQDGQTVVIGGILRDNETLTTSKTPILGDLPFLGQFFRSREKSRSKTELMIFMTPHIVETDAQARDMTKKTAVSVVNQIPNLSQQQPNLKLTPKKDMEEKLLQEKMSEKMMKDKKEEVKKP